MPKSLADGRTKVALLSSKPTVAGVKLTELSQGKDISCNILSSAYTLGATDSDKIAEKPLCATGNSNAIGASNYAADLTVFRFFDATSGLAVGGEDFAYSGLTPKGKIAYLVERESGKLSTAAFATGDKVTVYEVIVDHPQKPSDQGGYIKRRIGMEVQAVWKSTLVAT